MPTAKTCNSNLTTCTKSLLLRYVTCRFASLYQEVLGGEERGVENVYAVGQKKCTTNKQVETDLPLVPLAV